MPPKIAIPLQPIDFDIAKRVVDEHAAERQVPTLTMATHATAGQGLSKPDQRRRLLRKLTIALPDYIIDAMHQRTIATKPRCTIQSIIVEGLAAIGFDIHDADRVSDGRRRPNAR